ncbi:gp53-like domain-containing protein [Xenorhabdus kozodoii]|uniref:gp53-like domain-containing protein n=1 Tax=Xenorhabdus kozodoii TaxID=351676 RepID=UPI001145224A|nr:hypothetical protein [Xenorhabdus kozodoii]
MGREYSAAGRLYGCSGACWALAVDNVPTDSAAAAMLASAAVCRRLVTRAGPLISSGPYSPTKPNFPAGIYQTAGNYAIRGECYTKAETYSRREIDSRISPRNTASATTNGWWECGDTGIIYQWGIAYQGGVIKFPKQFRTQCFSVVTNIYYNGSVESSDTQWPVFNIKADSFQTIYSSKGWYLTWFAIGK